MFKEFKKFALRGNVIDMAVGIIVGTAFKEIIDALVENVIMPPIGLLIGGIDFSNFKVVLKEATQNSEAVTIDYGLFLNSILDFLIIAFVIFIVVRQINRFHEKKEEKKSSGPSEEILLLREIRDQLKKK